jgi:hypothetical protein
MICYANYMLNVLQNIILTLLLIITIKCAQNISIDETLIIMLNDTQNIMLDNKEH